MRDELPGLEGEFKVVRYVVSPAFQGRQLGRLIKGVLHFHAAKLLDVPGFGPIKATSANLYAAVHSTCFLF
jgi:hypothetical protein